MPGRAGPPTQDVPDSGIRESSESPSSLFGVPGAFLSPFPPQSGLVSLFPGVKALGLICFPGSGKTQECDVEKRTFFFSMPLLLSSLYSSQSYFLFSFSLCFFFLLSGFSPGNVRTPCFAPNQTQTTEATGNQGKSTKNLTDQQNTASFTFQHAWSGLDGEGWSLGGGNF